MNTSIKELNMNELEQVIGGGACLSTGIKKLFNMAGNWISETIAPACDEMAIAARNVTSAVINQIQIWIG